MFFWMFFLLLNWKFCFYKNGRSTFGDIVIAAICYAAGGYIYVFIESCYSSTMGYLTTSFNEADAASYVRSLIAKKPYVITTAVCYHLEARYREVSYRDANGNTAYRTETYLERVNTWTGTHFFNFDFWKDNSDTNNIPLPKSGDILRIKLIKEIVFANEATRYSFTKQKQEFENSNRHRDTHMDITTDFNIARFKEHIMAYDPQTEIPCWMNKYCFVLWSILFLSWPFRIMLQCNTKKCFFKFLKEISIVPLETITQQPSAPSAENYPSQPCDISTVHYPDNDMTSPSNMMPSTSQPQVGEAPPTNLEAIGHSFFCQQQKPDSKLIGNQNNGYDHDS